MGEDEEWDTPTLGGSLTQSMGRAKASVALIQVRLESCVAG